MSTVIVLEVQCLTCSNSRIIMDIFFKQSVTNKERWNTANGSKVLCFSEMWGSVYGFNPTPAVAVPTFDTVPERSTSCLSVQDYCGDPAQAQCRRWKAQEFCMGRLKLKGNGIRVPTSPRRWDNLILVGIGLNWDGRLLKEIWEAGFFTRGYMEQAAGRGVRSRFHYKVKRKQHLVRCMNMNSLEEWAPKEDKWD